MSALVEPASNVFPVTDSVCVKLNCRPFEYLSILPPKGKRQYLLTLQVSRYCLLPLQCSIVQTGLSQANHKHRCVKGDTLRKKTSLEAACQQVLHEQDGPKRAPCLRFVVETLDSEVALR